MVGVAGMGRRGRGDYLEVRRAVGDSRATVRTTRAAVAKVHQVSGLTDPTADGLMRDVLRRIEGEGTDRGRGQVVGIGWAHVEAAASLASNGGDSLRGIRDGAILRVMSDTLARIGFMIGAGLRVHHASRSAIRRTERAEDPEQAPAPRRAAGPSPCRAAAYSPAPPIGHTTGAPPARRCAPVRCRSPARSRIGTAQCTGFHRGRPPGCMFTQRTG